MSVNADKLVQIIPRIIEGGTPGLTFAGLLLSQSELLPAGRVVQFASAQAVANYFGPLSDEAGMASMYFSGYVNTTSLPDKLFFARYAGTPAAAWLRGARYTGNLAVLQAVTNGGLSISIDNKAQHVTGIDLSSTTSLSMVAEAIQTALAPAKTPATAGYLHGGVISAEAAAFKTVEAGALNISIDGTLHELTSLDFSAVEDLAGVAGVLEAALSVWATVELEVDHLLITSRTAGANSGVSFASNPGGSSEPAPTPTTDLAGALGLTSATGATEAQGTPEIQAAGPSVTYSSQTGAFQITSPTTGADSAVSWPAAVSGTDLGALLLLTEQDGAVRSVGMAAQTLPDCMSNVLMYARDWVTFGTVWEPELDDKIALARWCAGYDTRFAYVMWDTDNAAQVAGSTASAGYQIARVLELDGTVPVFNTPELAAWVMGTAASINFEETNGRLTFAFKQGEGLAVTCDNDEAYDALIANSYNCYADFATASSQFRFFQNGQVSGKWGWLDTYLDAIAIKDGLQLNLLDLFKAVKCIPYNESGYGMIRTACLDTITRFLDFGAIRTGVTLSNTQKVQLLAEIGQDVSRTLETQGWYMQVKDPGATVRGQRQSPECRFYYMDGGSVQQIVMPATAIQ